MDIFDSIINQAQIACEVQRLIERIKKLERWINRRCGNCNYWMCRGACPKEKRINGRPKGPSMNEYGCNKFSLKEYQIKYYEREKNEIRQDAYFKYISKEYLVRIGFDKAPINIVCPF